MTLLWNVCSCQELEKPEEMNENVLKIILAFYL